MIYRFLTCLETIVCLCALSVNELSKSRYVLPRNGIRNRGEVFTREEVSSATHCAVLCLNKPPCVAFNLKNGMDCELLAGDSAEATLELDATTVHASNASFSDIVGS